MNTDMGNILHGQPTKTISTRIIGKGLCLNNNLSNIGKVSSENTLTGLVYNIAV